jgi:hypothetical protein
MIKGALKQISHALAEQGDIHDNTYRLHWRHLRHQLLRNHWLGRCRGTVPRLAVKAIFRMKRKLYG